MGYRQQSLWKVILLCCQLLLDAWKDEKILIHNQCLVVLCSLYRTANISFEIMKNDEKVIAEKNWTKKKRR